MTRLSLLCCAASVASLLVFADGSAASPAATFRVGLVVGPGADSAYDRAAVAGLRRAVRSLGVEGRVFTPSLKEGYLPTFLYLARRGYKLVIAGSALQLAAVDRAAAAYPSVRLAILAAASPRGRNNVLGVTFAAEQASYLAGYLAGRMADVQPGEHAISSIGGIKAPPVDQFIAGYRAGARRASTGIRTMNAYVQNFIDPARCRAAALSQIAKGSQVVFPVAGLCGVGALEAAREQGVWGIGVDIDQSSLGPQILTSAVKNVDAAVYEAIREVRAGRPGGRTLRLGLRGGGVGLGRLSAKVPRPVAADVERIRRLIMAGKITVPTTLG